jgi:hypothetical protein
MSFGPPIPCLRLVIVRELLGRYEQALTGLRAPRWFEHYGKYEDLEILMNRRVEAITAAPGFMQQMSPWTGVFTASAGYSPAMLGYVDFVDRLGVFAP